MSRNPLRAAARTVRAWRDEHGNAAIMFALAAPVLLGGAGLAVETSFDYFSHNHLQSAADAAAYAAAIESMAGSNAATINAAASQQAAANGWTSGSGSSITVHNPPTSGPNAGAANAVEVVLTQNTPRFFTAFFSSQPLTIGTRSVAITQTAANACILALNKTAAQAVNFQGNTTVTLNGCDVVSDSVATDGINVWGSSVMSADCAMSSGGITNHGGMTLAGCSSGITQAPRVADPFANLATPSAGSHQNIPNGNQHGTLQLQPGSYTNGMDLQGTVNLAPGVYYVSGGNFHINSNAVITGSGVTIYLAAGANVDMNGTATVTLSAPTSGTYSGILFFGDRNGTGTNKFDGTASSSMTGDLYFPSEEVTYQGNFSGANGCTHVVADTVQWTGSSTISVSCANQGMTPIPARQAVKLVE